MFASGDPAEHMPLGQILNNLQQSAFGVFLFVAILPSFIPIPGMGCGQRPTRGPDRTADAVLPAPALAAGFHCPTRAEARHHAPLPGPYRSPVAAAGQDAETSPAAVADTAAAHAFSGLLLLLGLLLSLPIPFTNFLFGFQLLLFSLALLERDGALMLFNWIAALVAIAFFGFSSGQLVGYTVELFQRWF